MIENQKGTRERSTLSRVSRELDAVAAAVVVVYPECILRTVFVNVSFQGTLNREEVRSRAA